MFPGVVSKNISRKLKIEIDVKSGSVFTVLIIMSDTCCHLSKTKMQELLQEGQKQNKKLPRTFLMSFFSNAYNVNFK